MENKYIIYSCVFIALILIGIAGLRADETKQLNVLTPNKIVNETNKEVELLGYKYVYDEGIILISNQIYNAEWYPDSSPKNASKNLTIELQIENFNGRNYSLVGNGDIPKYYTGHFDFNLSSNKLADFNDISPLLTWKLSNTFKYSEGVYEKIIGYENITKDDETKETPIYENITFQSKVFSNYNPTSVLSAKTILNKPLYLDPYVDTCGVLSTADSVYTLNQSVVSNSTCFNITANNVTLNGAGFTINYSANASYGFGVYVNGVNWTTIKNAVIKEGTSATNGKYGIYFVSANNGTIQNNSITSSSGNGIGIYASASSNSNNFSNNIIRTLGTTGHGIYLMQSNSNNLYSNNITTLQGGNCIYLYIAQFSTISSNTITSTSTTSGGDGIYFYNGGSSNNIIGNNITTAGGRGVWSELSSNNTFSGNKITSSSSIGFYLTGTASSNFNHSIDSSNWAEGLPVLFNYSINNQVVANNSNNQYGQIICAWCNNITYDNITMGGDGISLFNVSNSNVQNSNISTSVGRGVFLEKGENNRIANNSITTGTNSYLYGIYSSSSDRNNVTNNKINTTANYWIYIYPGSNWTISGNVVNTSGGFYLRTVTDSIISNNSVVSVGYGLWLPTTSNRNKILNNFVSSAGSANLYLDSSSYLNVSNNVFITSGLQAVGFFFIGGASHSVFVNNSIVASGSQSHGMSLRDAINMSFSLMNIRTSTTNANAVPIYLQMSYINFSVTDSILNSTSGGGVDFYVMGAVTSSIWNFTNVTRADGTPINVTWITGANGTLNMMWYADVYTNYSNGTIAPSANITSYDISAIWKASSLTSTSGTTRHTLLEYIRNATSGTNYTYFSNYSINATLVGQNLSSSQNMSANKYIVFTFTAAGVANSCTYSGSGNWAILCSDGCNITANTDLLGNNFSMTGSGYVQISANITNWKYGYINQGVVYVTNGGGIR
jgi:parallel beta-helix repeat protein